MNQFPDDKDVFAMWALYAPGFAVVFFVYCSAYLIYTCSLYLTAINEYLKECSYPHITKITDRIAICHSNLEPEITTKGAGNSDALNHIFYARNVIYNILQVFNEVRLKCFKAKIFFLM